MAEPSGSVPMSPTAPSRRVLADLVVILQLGVVVPSVVANTRLTWKLAPLYRQGGMSPWFPWVEPMLLAVSALLLVRVMVLIARASARAVPTYLVASLIVFPTWALVLLSKLGPQWHPAAARRQFAIALVMLLLPIGEYFYLRWLVKQGELR